MPKKKLNEKRGFEITWLILAEICGQCIFGELILVDQK